MFSRTSHKCCMVFRSDDWGCHERLWSSSWRLSRHRWICLAECLRELPSWNVGPSWGRVIAALGGTGPVKQPPIPLYDHAEPSWVLKTPPTPGGAVWAEGILLLSLILHWYRETLLPRVNVSYTRLSAFGCAVFVVTTSQESLCQFNSEALFLSDTIFLFEAIFMSGDQLSCQVSICPSQWALTCSSRSPFPPQFVHVWHIAVMSPLLKDFRVLWMMRKFC